MMLVKADPALSMVSGYSSNKLVALLCLVFINPVTCPISQLTVLYSIIANHITLYNL